MPTEPTELIKQISNFEVTFTLDWGEENDEISYLTIEIPSELQQLLNLCAVKEPITSKITVGDQAWSFIRYKCKRLIYSNLFDYKDILFSKDLINNKIIKIPFTSASHIDNCIGCIRDNIKKMVEIMYRYSDMKIKVTFESSASQTTLNVSN